MSITHLFHPVDEKRASRSRSYGAILATVFVYVLVFWVALPAFLFATGFRLDALWPVGWLETTAARYVGGGLLALGALVMAGSIGQLWRQGKGLPISHLPPTRLVVRGLYRYLRHPIYVGYTLAVAGAALVLGSFWCLAFSTPLLLAGWIAYTLYLEEPRLVERFGDAYRAYRARTRLLWPVPRTPAPATTPRRLVRLMARLNGLANRTIFYRRGNLILVTYGVFCTIGGFLFGETTATLLVQQGLSPAHAGLFLIGMTLVLSLFAWLFWWVGQWRTLRHERWWGLGRIGFISYGGLAGLLLFTVAFAHWSGRAALMLTDVVMQGLFFVYAFGRIGCLTYGCCYGRPTQHPWGVTYENPAAKMIRLGDRRRVARHPTQLYAFAHGVLLVLLLNAMAWAPIPAGLLTAAGLMLAGLGRTFTESYRDRSRPLFGRFTYGHLGSWATFLAGWLLLFALTPGVDAHAPVPLTATALAASLPVLPFVLLSSLFVLIIYGVHWKRIGTWVG